MKGLHVLKALVIICSLALWLAAAPIENILSSDQQAVIELKRQQALSDSDYLKRSWISPLLLQGSYQESWSRFSTHSGDHSSGTVGMRIDQDIFRSGGILAAHRYAQMQGLFGSSGVHLELQTLVGEAYGLLYGLHRLSLQLEKQSRLLLNAQIDIRRKQEQYDQGLIDSSILHTALLERNALAAQKLELEGQLQQNEHAFSRLSDHPWQNLKLPQLEMIESEQFLSSSQNLALSLAHQKYQASAHYSQMIAAKYLPRLSVGGSYQHFWHDEANQEQMHSWGVTLTIPLDIKGRYEHQGVLLAARIAAHSADLERKRQNTLLQQSKLKEQQQLKQIALAHEDIALYESLLQRTGDRILAGTQTEDDRIVMVNAKEARKLDLKLYKLSIAQERLKLYLGVHHATL